MLHVAANYSCGGFAAELRSLCTTAFEPEAGLKSDRSVRSQLQSRFPLDGGIVPCYFAFRLVMNSISTFRIFLEFVIIGGSHARRLLFFGRGFERLSFIHFVLRGDASKETETAEREKSRKIIEKNHIDRLDKVNYCEDFFLYY